MSALIRIRGAILDVDAVLASLSALEPCAVFRKGDLTGAEQGPSKYEASGAYFDVDGTDFQTLDEQFVLFEEFARLYEDDVLRLTTSIGIDEAYVDFAVVKNSKMYPLQKEYLSLERIALLTRLNLGFQISSWSE